MSQEGSEKQKLLHGVAVLMPATAIAKVVGLCYKIPLIAIVGISGMAYFLAAYHLYSAVFVLVATGLPTALSLSVARYAAAGETKAAQRALWVSVTLLCIVGLCGSAALLFFAPQLAQRIAMADAAAAIVAVAPALLLSAFTGAVKGYFQGLHRMLPTAVSEVIEALGKLGFGLCFALLAKGRGASAPVVAAYAVCGITAGLALAATVLAVWLCLHLWRTPRAGNAPVPPRRTLFLELWHVATPITVNALVMSLGTLADTALISRRLQAAGFAPLAANALYSCYGNLALPLYNLVPTLLTPVALALMPTLGAALARGDLRAGQNALATALRLTALLAIPSALGLALLAQPLLTLIYGTQEGVTTAATLLSLLALSVLPLALLTLLGAALQAAGHAALPVWAMAVGLPVKLGVEWLLLALPQVHVYGAPISTLCCNLTVLIIEAVALARHLPFRPIAPRDLFLPFGAALPAVGAGVGAYVWLSAVAPEARWIVLPPLALTVAVFLPFALRLGALTGEDLDALPGGRLLCALLRRCKMLK